MTLCVISIGLNKTILKAMVWFFDKNRNYDVDFCFQILPVKSNFEYFESFKTLKTSILPKKNINGK
jgi:hypothetical protein